MPANHKFRMWSWIFLWAIKIENLKTQVLLNQLPYLTNVYNCLYGFLRIFSSINSQDLEDSNMIFGDKHFRPLANKDRSRLFSTAWLQRLAKNFNTSFLNWKTCILVTFPLSISLFNSYFIPNPKSTLLISFWFVSSGTSSFINKLAV